MKSILLRVCLCLVLLVSVAGVASADEQPSHLLYVQGGENSITSGADENVSLTIRDVVPYGTYISGGKEALIPVTILNCSSFPATAALVMTDGRNESVSFVTISHISLTEENTTLILRVSPEKYYEGEELRSFNSGTVDIRTLLEKKFDGIGLYIEKQEQPKENDGTRDCITYCKKYMREYIQCLVECGGV